MAERKIFENPWPNLGYYHVCRWCIRRTSYVLQKHDLAVAFTQRG